MQVENLIDFGLVSGEYKMVFVVRNDLKMSKVTGGYFHYMMVGDLLYFPTFSVDMLQSAPTGRF